MKIGEKIKNVRKKLGLSVTEVFLRCVEIFGPQAPSYKTLLRMEKGKEIRGYNLQKICQALNVPIMELVNYPKIDKEHVITRKNKSPFKFNIDKNARYSILNCLSMEYSVTEIIIEPQGKIFPPKSPDDRKKYQKTVIVNRGDVKITINNEEFRLKTGDTISFNSKNKHFIQNEGVSKCKLYVIQHPLPPPGPNEEILISDVAFLYDDSLQS